jgi:hypothetical protein
MFAGCHELKDLTFVGSTRQARVAIRFAKPDFPIVGQQCSGCGYSPKATFWQSNSISCGFGVTKASLIKLKAGS